MIAVTVLVVGLPLVCPWFALGRGYGRGSSRDHGYCHDHSHGYGNDDGLMITVTVLFISFVLLGVLVMSFVR